MRVVISAGGTGGHIYPALAIINKIKDLEVDSEFLYIGTTDRMESRLVPSLGINYVGVSMMGIDRKHLFKNVEVLYKYVKAKSKVKKYIKDFNPDIVIGVGGYITAPVIYMAHKLGYKTVIHEQNSIPGVSNRKLAKIVDKVFISLPDSGQYFPKDKVVYTGNPRSEEIISIKPARLMDYGFSRTKKLVIIVMGSLGSATINSVLVSMVRDFKDKNYQVLLITGERYFNDYKDIDIPSNVKVVPFLDNFINILKSCDLIVSRAGASTISEITAISLPSILVPSPYVTNNHQLKNAQELESAGACKILLEKDFSGDNLISLIDLILNNDDVYNSMRSGAKSLGITDSATRVYKEIKKVIEVL